MAVVPGGTLAPAGLVVLVNQLAAAVAAALLAGAQVIGLIAGASDFLSAALAAELVSWGRGVLALGALGTLGQTLHQAAVVALAVTEDRQDKALIQGMAVSMAVAAAHRVTETSRATALLALFASFGRAALANSRRHALVTYRKG